MPSAPKRRAKPAAKRSKPLATPPPPPPAPVVEPANDPASLAVEADRERRITRSAAARMLGISVTSLRRAEQMGEIPFSVDAHTNVHRFSEHELKAYGARFVPATKRDGEGERHAKAFAHFDGGGSPQSCVVALRCTFPEAERFYKDWSSGAGLVFTRDQIAEIESLGIEPRAPAIIAAVRRLRDRLREARAARDRPTLPAR